MSYDRASVERFVAELDEQRRRLQAQVDAAREDVREAKAAAAERAEAQAELAARFLEAQSELERAELDHRTRLASIRGDAADVAARVLASALEHVDAMRAATSVAATGTEGAR